MSLNLQEEREEIDRRTQERQRDRINHSSSFLNFRLNGVYILSKTCAIWSLTERTERPSI
jgi:hypothetical protein